MLTIYDKHVLNDYQVFYNSTGEIILGMFIMLRSYPFSSYSLNNIWDSIDEGSNYVFMLILDFGFGMFKKGVLIKYRSMIGMT